MSTSNDLPTPEEIIRARAELFKLEGELSLALGRAELRKYVAIAHAAGITDDHPLVKALLQHLPEPPEVPELPVLEIPKIEIPVISPPSL